MANVTSKTYHGLRPAPALLALVLGSILSACGAGGGAGKASLAVRIAPLRTASAGLASAGRGRVIFVDAGHGGKDWGGKARKPDGVWIGEKTYTLDIALRTARLLQEKGYTVVLSRTEEGAADQWSVNNPPRDLNGDGDVDGIDDVQERVNLANNARADILLSIHLNGRETPSGAIDPTFNGVTTLFDPDRPFAAENRRLAALVQQEMLGIMTRALGRAPHDWGVADDTTLPTPFTTSHTSYHHDVELGPSEPNWIDASRMPGVISEPLFMTNPEEQAALLQDDLRQQLAAGYVRAVDAFFAGG